MKQQTTPKKERSMARFSQADRSATYGCSCADMFDFI